MSSAESERRRRRLQALGETLATASADETAAGWSEDAEETRRDDDLRRNIPPHHG